MQAIDDAVIVIPVLNEAEAIGKVLDELREEGVPMDRVLVVDGGSTDGSREIARSRGARVVPQEGQGKAGAIKTAAELVDAEYMLLMDGDYSYPARYVHVLLEKIKKGGWDLVIGARVFTPGSQPLLYRVGNRVLTWFFNTLFGSKLSDVLSGMYAVRTRVLREMLFEARGFGIESEIAAHVVSTTGRVAEVPIEYRRRLGRKKLGLCHGPRILREMVRLAWRYNPSFIASASSAAMLVPGLALSLVLIYRRLAGEAVNPYQGIAALVLVMTGLLSLLLAILTLFLKRMEYRLARRIAELEKRVESGDNG